MKKPGLMKRSFSLLRYAMKLCPKYAGCAVMASLVSTSRSLLYVLFPGLLVELLTNSSSMSVPLVAITVFYLLVTVADAVAKRFSLRETALGYAMNNRGTLRIGQKGMRIPFQHWDIASYMDGNLRAVRGSWIYMGICDTFFENLLSAVYTLAVIAYIILQIHPLVLLALLGLTIWGVLLDRKAAGKRHMLEEERAAAEKKQQYDEYILLDLDFAKELRAFDAAGYIRRKYESSENELLSIEQRKARISARYAVFGHLLLLAESLLVYGAAILRYLDGRMSLSYFLVYFGAVMQLKDAVGKLFGFYSDLAEIDDFRRDIANYMEIPETMHTGTQATNSTSFTLEFRDVSFRYQQTDREVLSHVSFTLHDGEKLCIVGENGSGKTTLVKLLLRLYDPNEGVILLNGADIRAYRYEQYLSLVAPVFQDFKLHSYTLLENIVFDQKPDHPRIDALLRAYGLDNMISGLPHKLDTMVTRLLDEEGVEFSEGEKQKLAMVRAAYKASPALILDEPTASLDPLAEADFYQKVQALYPDKSVVFVSHRMSSAKLADRILVLEQGKITESGDFASLLNSDGVFSKMCREQAGFYSV